MDRKCPMIIAMQGNVYTGKTTLANELAKRLKSPTIRLDDILKLINPTEPQRPTSIQIDNLMSHAFDLICQIVETQISLGLSVIVDSPLSRLSHLHKLIGLISPDTRLLIIECKPNNEYVWQIRFEDLDSCNYENKWYKPCEWPLKSPEYTRDFTDDDIPLMVSKLVVNTTNFYSPCHMISAVYDVTSCGDRHIAEYDSTWHFIHKENKDQFKCPSCPKEEHGQTSRYKGCIHLVIAYKQEGIDYDATCAVCQSQVTKSSGGCYTCEYCPLALHKSCAELDGQRVHFDPESFPKFLQTEPDVSYTFPEEHPCVECREEGKAFSSECRPCVFESHLRSRLLPTVLRHEAHEEHLLAFAAKSTLEREQYICLACRKYGAFVAYVCLKCSPGTYHPECALLPPLLEHVHGGYTHDLKMVFHREKEMEDYLCDLCFNKMDPQAWYYHCNKCVLSLHLECAYVDFDK